MTQIQQTINDLADSGLLAGRCFDWRGNLRGDAHRQLCQILTGSAAPANPWNRPAGPEYDAGGTDGH